MPASRSRPIAVPPGGWLRRIRETLGLSRRVVAERLAVTHAAVRDYEEAERREAISLATLRRVADALGCDVVVTIVPRNPGSLLRTEPRTHVSVSVPEARDRIEGEVRVADDELEPHLK